MGNRSLATWDMPCDCILTENPGDSDTGKTFTNQQTEMAALTKDAVGLEGGLNVVADEAGQNRFPAVISNNLPGA